MPSKKKTTAKAESTSTTEAKATKQTEGTYLVPPGGISPRLLERREETRKFEQASRRTTAGK